MTDQLMTIREMCDSFDVTPRALRFYEAKELLSPIREGTRRLFTKADRARLTLILRGKRFGFSLEEIRQWLLIYEHEGTEVQMRRFLEMADRQLGLLEEQRRQLAETTDELRALREGTARQLGECPPAAPRAGARGTASAAFRPAPLGPALTLRHTAS